MQHQLSQWPDWKIKQYSLRNASPSALPLSLETTGEAPGAEASADLLYVQPLRQLGETQNPFRHPDRLYDVDFGMPHQYVHTVTLMLPTGYEVQELPASVALALPDNGGRFQYSVTPKGNSLVIMSRLQLLKPLYSASEYPGLRELYSRMLAKHAEAIVLKKK